MQPRRLHNPFWELMVAGDRPRLLSLRLDARGRSRWCENLLKTGTPRTGRHPLALPWGGVTGHVDAAGAWHLSASGEPPRVVSASETAIELDGIAYGGVAERWTIRLDGPRLEWAVSQEWLADAALADAFTPGLFFAARPEWGQATFFQLWERGMAHDAFYGCGNIHAPEAATTASRATRRTPGGWAVAKLLSHACPDGDLRVEVSHHLKKGELVNWVSMLGQSPWCDAEGGRDRRKGEIVATVLALEATFAETGAALDVSLGGAWGREAAANRRFFDTHANCGIMADTDEWRLGNQPAGYVALMCRYMHAEMLKFGVRRAALGPDSRDPQEVLAGEVLRMAGNLARHGTVGKGFQSGTSLDFLPSFLLSARDSLVASGEREFGTALWPGMSRGLESLRAMLGEGGGVIFSPRNHGNDYFDWLARDGRIGYLNILAWMGLRGAAETARWLGHPAEAEEAEGLARTLAARFNADFWSEERGYYADWIDVNGIAHHYLYSGPQVMAIAAGLVPADRAARILDAIDAMRRDLGPAWEGCFSIQTNFIDSSEYSLMRLWNGTDEMRFGETMNGGCLASWNYHWIGALARAGRAAEAAAAWRAVVGRFEATSLVEGSNYWNFRGQPSRTLTPNHEVPSAEPFLADQGLVAAALPRWLLGIAPGFDGIAVDPILPASAYPAIARVPHLGRERTIEIAGPGKIRIS